MTAEEVMLAVVRSLDGAGIAYVLVGSFASNYYGIPRSTLDADFLLQVEDIPLTMLGALLGSQFKIDRQAAFESITLGTHYTIHHTDSDFGIDLFLLRADPHDQLNFSRRKLVSYGKGTMYVPTPEDVIVTKLRWSKSGRRHKDVDDVANVLAVRRSATLDLDYIRKWTDEHGTRELFERLLAGTPEI